MIVSNMVQENLVSGTMLTKSDINTCSWHSATQSLMFEYICLPAHNASSGWLPYC